MGNIAAAARIPGAAAHLLAHQGGWDEILLVVGPMALVAGLLWLAKRRVTRAVVGRARYANVGRSLAERLSSANPGVRASSSTASQIRRASSPRGTRATTGPKKLVSSGRPRTERDDRRADLLARPRQGELGLLAHHDIERFIVAGGDERRRQGGLLDGFLDDCVVAVADLLGSPGRVELLAERGMSASTAALPSSRRAAAAMRSMRWPARWALT